MSQSATQGWFFVDDTDARLLYSPVEQWQLSNGSTIQSGGDTLDNIDNSWAGKIWNNTAHGTTSDGANVTFVFNGTGYAVFGSYLFPGRSPKGRIACFLDGNPVAEDFTEWSKGQDDNFSGVEGNLVFTCGKQISQGEHELVINVDSLINSTFFLDYIVYEPISTGSEGEDAEEVMMMIGNPLETLFDTSSEHQVVDFGNGWSVNNDFLFSVDTRTPGASVTVDFNGTSILLYGNLGIGSNLSNSAIYQLDDRPEQSFSLVPPFDGSKGFLAQQFFNLSELSPTEEHRLVVKHNGTEEGMALSLNYFVVETVPPGTVVSSAPLNPSSPSPSSPASVTTGKHHLDAGALGGIIGGAVVLLVLCGIGSCLWLKSRRKARNKRLNLDSTLLVHTEITRSDFNQLRWGNLKLQQRLAVLQSRNQDAEYSGQPDFEIVAAERRESQLVIHADSGWRVEQQRGADAETREVPPTYTEA
ncbi:hypothetical protein D9758_013053 [Tetrapyrgos nigripes]|uniref:Uncharacterized protein n=1 Tax=Tetrapyrgos nigripes TaxID=182062 RepID=A0A8H5CPX7_9AGAR|nr:hypothetical protein D9758_013053 [Tetrapyrgos nigripes]